MSFGFAAFLFRRISEAFGLSVKGFDNKYLGDVKNIRGGLDYRHKRKPAFVDLNALYGTHGVVLGKNSADTGSYDKVAAGYDSSLTGLVKDSEDESLLNLYIGIFDNIKDATIQNVTFENVIYEVNTFNSRINKIVVVPLANKITNSKVSNVTIKGNYSYTMLPKDPFNKDTDLIYYTTKEQISVEIDSESQLNNIEIIINTGEEDNE